ncbi:MAG: antibiotic biosynthesis monooxygenase family protein [Chloroflexota bacterium]
MFVVIHRITCSAASAEQVERAFPAAANLEGVPGFRGSRLLKNTRDDERLEYLAIFEWESRAAFEAWSKSESFRHAGQSMDLPSVPTVRTETYETLG